MKHFGSTMDFTQQRDAALRVAFRHVQRLNPNLPRPSLAALAVLQPCERFWVSEERAAIVLSEMIRRPFSILRARPLKRAMYLEIHTRYTALRRLHPTLPLKELVTRIIHTPAPQFYLDPLYAIKILNRPLRN